jgi:hypothetical protein
MEAVIRGVEYYKPLLDVLIVLLQAGLLIAAVWLAQETQRLRVRTSDQVRLLYEQDRRRVTPQLYFDVEFPKEKAPDLQLVAVNLSDQTAFNLDSWYYERANRNLRTCNNASPYLAKGETESYVIVTEGRYTPEEAVARIAETSKHARVELNIDKLRDIFQHEPANYAVLLFSDRDGRACALKRSNVDADGANAPHFFEL